MCTPYPRKQLSHATQGKHKMAQVLGSTLYSFVLID